MALLLIFGSVSVSNQLSTDGVNSIFPIQLGVAYGWTVSYFVPKSWVIIENVVYVNVIKFPVLRYPFSCLPSLVVSLSIKSTLLKTDFGLNSPLIISTATL